MTREQIEEATFLLDRIKNLEQLKDKIYKKGIVVNKDSTKQEIMEFLTFVADSGFLGILTEIALSAMGDINSTIAELEEKLKEL